MTYQWTFGDNTSSTDQNPTKVYTTAGTFNVKLVVTSNNGCKDSVTQTITVNPKPTPAFTVNSSSQCLSGNSFTFTNTSTIGSGTMTYQWNFGDNNTSTATSPTHSYAATGTYTVKLVVTSNNGCRDSISQNVTVNQSVTYYRDRDGDGFGNPNETSQGCTAPTGFVSDNTDCDDTRASVKPGGTEHFTVMQMAMALEIQISQETLVQPLQVTLLTVQIVMIQMQQLNPAELRFVMALMMIVMVR
jgi:PKD repeat protein